MGTALMNWLKEKFGGKDNKGPEVKQAKRPAVRPATPAGRAPRSAPAGSDAFRFREGAGARVQKSGARSAGVPQFGKYAPRPGTCAVEVYHEDGQLMAYDMFRVDEVPPAAAHLINKYPSCTDVTHGRTGFSHVELKFDLKGEHPVELPEHILAKRELGARYAKLWWSRHEYTG
jgi:hypothetical protein